MLITLPEQNKTRLLRCPGGENKKQQPDNIK